MLIKFREQVPSIYPSASRDFQYLGWLIDIVLNGVKHNVDDLYDLPNSKTDPRLTELLAMTLGFKIKRNYDQKQLQALVAALQIILKYKGTMTAVNMAGNALIAASGAVGNFTGEVKNGELKVTLPKSLIDISLFTDLLPYIMPAGMTCHIVRKNQLEEDYNTKLVHQNSLLAEWVQDLDWDDDNQTTTGLAHMFNAGESFEIYANFTDKDGKRPLNDELTLSNRILNTGLLDNNIIPAHIPQLCDAYSEMLQEEADKNAEQESAEGENT
jgi:hypothetical protein